MQRFHPRRSANVLGLAFILMLVSAAFSSAAELERRTWQVDGVTREGLVAQPSVRSESAPLIFGFHGHGGTARFASRSYHLHELWPEAYVVYLQGLPTPGGIVDLEGKRPGWQLRIGQQQDRDLHFFDAVLSDMKSRHSIDTRRIYSMGHSNGGAFTYLLAAKRPEVFAAIAPSAAVGPLPTTAIPCFHIAGRNDPLVKFSWQELMIHRVLKTNACEKSGVQWAPNCLEYKSSQDAPLVTLIHDGGHEFAPEAPQLMIRFFQDHKKPTSAQSLQEF